VPSKSQSAIAIVLQEQPDVYLTALPGPWLLAHSTPSWRIEDPLKGFQRIVKEERAKEIARTVLDTNRTFPNAVTLATMVGQFSCDGNLMTFPAASKFLVVDGQHRLWAQRFSKHSGLYPCVIHMKRTEAEMAALFLEINDNQRRVPSSLRWDLVRLVRHEDLSIAMTADIVYELATRKDSPFYSVGIDLTGEKKDVTIKQGSLAPEIRTLLARDLKRQRAGVDDYVALLIRFFTAIRSLDSDGWGNPQSAFFKARVLRALLRVLSDLLTEAKKVSELTTPKLRTCLEQIDPETLSDERVRKIQGSAGVHDLYKQMREQVFGS
jgi:DGQHR domain-containing protein